MAGDWLKMEAATPDKPEVLAIAARMGWDDPDLAVGKLFRVWRWFDQHTTNGNAPGVTCALLDRIAGVSGFALAMQSVGWLRVDDAGLTLPNFEKHCGKTAKERAQTARRVASHKEKQTGNATTNALTVSSALPREEKRREEVNHSVANATGGKPPMSPDEIIFGYGLPLLVSAGSTDKAARSFLGGLRKHHGDDALINTLRECLKAKPLQPTEWIAAALPPHSRAGPRRIPAPENFDAVDYGTGGRL